MKEKYVIAIAIVLSTIIYVFGNRYFFIANTSKQKEGVFDKFTGKIYWNKGTTDYVDGTYTSYKLENTTKEEGD